MSDATAFGAFRADSAQAPSFARAALTAERGGFARCCRGWSILLRAGPSMSRIGRRGFDSTIRPSATERGALFNPVTIFEELDFLRAHTPVGGVFVDVGANVGTYALVLARHVGAGEK